MSTGETSTGTSEAAESASVRVLSIDTITSAHFHEVAHSHIAGTVYDEQTGQQYDATRERMVWIITDDAGRDFRAGDSPRRS